MADRVDDVPVERQFCTIQQWVPFDLLPVPQVQGLCLASISILTRSVFYRKANVRL